MATRLPHELCLNIIECISTNRKNCLRQAALVCCAWTAPAQRLLFRVIFLYLSRPFTLSGATRKFTPLERVIFLAQNPRLASYVTAFGLTGASVDERIDMARLAAAVFPNVERLRVSDGEPTVFNAILHVFPLVKTLDWLPSVTSSSSGDAIWVPVEGRLSSIRLVCRNRRIPFANLLLRELEYTSSRETLHCLYIKVFHGSTSSWMECLRHLEVFSNLRRMTLFFPDDLSSSQTADLVDDPGKHVLRDPSCRHDNH
jgi:hypothetical protein